jgi:TetR/AcrR family transcriptional regulator, cholesterol catabolism regulator
VPRKRPSGGADPYDSRRGTMNEARWEEILRAAAAEFNARGYRAARLQDIAHRVGLLTGSLYYYIDSKEDLLYAIAKSSTDLARETMVEDDAMAGSDAITRLRGFISRQMAIMDQLLAPPGGVERAVESLAPERGAEVLAVRRALLRFVRAIIDQGIHDGDFDPDVDASIATNSLFELLSTTRLWLRPGRATYAEVGDWYARVIVRSLVRRERIAELPDPL